MGDAAAARSRRRRRVGRPIVRVVVVLLATAGALLLASALFAGVEVKDFAAALAAAVLIGLVNALVWPLAIRLLLPLTVLTLGLGVLVLNGGVVLLVSATDPGFEVNGLGAAISVAILLTVVNTGVTSLMAIDDDAFYYRNVVKRRARRSHGAAASGA